MTKEKIRLMFKDVTVDGKTENYIIKKIGSVEKMLDRITRVEVEIDQDKKGIFRVEAMIKTPRDLYRAEDQGKTVEAAVDLVENEIKNQIRKNKDKISTLKRRGCRSIKKKTVIDESARF